MAIYKCFLLLILSIAVRPLLAQLPPGSNSLRVDINADDRADMRTVGWENWFASEGNHERSFGNLTVSLRCGNDNESIRLVSDKAMVTHGVTLGADAVMVTSDSSPVLEITIRGLTSGPHSFVGFHHAIGEHIGTYAVKVLKQSATNEQTATGIEPSKQAFHNEEVESSFVEFHAEEGVPTVVRISAVGGNRVLLSGFAIDVSNPRKKALKPVPMDMERHAIGDGGKVQLNWAPPASAVSQHIYMVADPDPAIAEHRLAAANKDSKYFVASVEGDSYTASIAANNSLLHYVWRVDSVEASGKIVRGDAWHFRVGHLAFPSAEGYGRFAIGGRGGRVMHVTNLDDSGPGSFREAVEARGPRTVVFDVSGLITLKSKLIFRGENEFLTIAGQTAPGKGICVRNYTLGGLGGRDVILRFIRLRLGTLSGETMDGMGFASCDHCIMDHCSISWTIDEAFSSRGAKNITFQRNLISEALNIAGHKKYPAGASHGFAGSIGGNVGSFHHSLLAHNAGRNWSLAGATDQANRHAGRLDIRNMLVYNWKHRTTDGGAREVNFVNNYYKPGPATEVRTYLNPQFENPSFGPQQYHVAGNVMEGVVGPEGPLEPFQGVQVRGKQDEPVFVKKPFFESYIQTHSALETYENVLADVGCNVPMLDDHDRRVIEEARTGTATYKGSKSGLPGLPDSEQDVGGWEDYPEVHRPADWDTDADGMPNAWEQANGLNPTDAMDGPTDSDGDGYTNLEGYLNSLTESKPHAAATRPLATILGTSGVVKTEFIYEQAPYPSCHAATIVETTNGSLVASWFGGTAERNPDVCIYVSRYQNGNWQEAKEVANGIQPDGSRLPTWNPVLFQAPGGELHLFYKIGPSPSTWWGMTMTSSDGGLNWSKPERLPGNLIGAVKNKPIVLKDGTWLSPSSNEAKGWTSHVELSSNAGKTWELIGPLNDGTSIRAIQPTLLAHPDGRVQMLARGRQGKIVESWSNDGGRTWTPLKDGLLPNNNSGLDAVALKDGRFLLVYNHSTSEQPGMGHKGRGILNVAISRDGKDWRASLVLDYLDQPEKQFSYPSVIQTSDGKVHIVYTWHRQRIKHVVLDPDVLAEFPMHAGQWPENVDGGLMRRQP